MFREVYESTRGGIPLVSRDIFRVEHVSPGFGQGKGQAPSIPMPPDA